MPRNSKQIIYEPLTTIPIDQTAVPGTGTVSSVSLTAPSILSVSGSPVTTTGTLGLTLATQTANTVFSGPTTGAAATPTFRALVAADIPSLSGTYQPLDADLTAIAALNSTGFARQAGTGSWSIVAETGSDAVVRATSPTINGILGTNTLVESSSTTVSPTASDSGKTYRCTASSASFALPTSGLTVGVHFRVQFTNIECSIRAGIGNVIQQLNDDSGLAPLSDENAVAYQYCLYYIEYVATNTWALNGVSTVI